jgi:hypothetical protein
MTTLKPEDVDWNLKENNIYWTGSTTGSHSKLEKWRHFHRQRMYLLTHGGSEQQITLLHSQSENNGAWLSYITKMSAVTSLFDTRITAVI